jgi:hypothetical protein
VALSVALMRCCNDFAQQFPVGGIQTIGSLVGIYRVRQAIST